MQIAFRRGAWLAECIGRRTERKTGEAERRAVGAYWLTPSSIYDLHVHAHLTLTGRVGVSLAPLHLGSYGVLK